jgi:hypothetical protein
VLRGDLLWLAKNPITSSNPDGDYLQGIGDADVRAVVHDRDARWTIGFGVRLTMLTGDDALGSGKWQMMPGAGFRVVLPEIDASSYLKPIVRYDVSFAGDPTKISPLPHCSQPAGQVSVRCPMELQRRETGVRWNFLNRVGSWLPSPDLHSRHPPISADIAHPRSIPTDARPGPIEKPK